jgi:SAM-dependent methyltransferase
VRRQGGRDVGGREALPRQVSLALLSFASPRRTGTPTRADGPTSARVLVLLESGAHGLERSLERLVGGHGHVGLHAHPLPVRAGDRVDRAPPGQHDVKVSVDPVAALANVRRALSSSGVLVAALWAEPERCPFYALPRRLLQRYRSVPPPALETPGTFRYANLEHIERDFSRAGLTIEHVEEMDVPVFEARTGAELVAWARALGSGLSPLLNDLPAPDQRAWETDFTAEMEAQRTGGLIRMRGVTRIVRAHPA